MDRLQRELLQGLNASGQLDWSAGLVDGSQIRALRDGPLTGPSPVDRASPADGKAPIAALMRIDWETVGRIVDRGSPGAWIRPSGARA
jgi:hypothetical protein